MVVELKKEEWDCDWIVGYSTGGGEWVDKRKG